MNIPHKKEARHSAPSFSSLEFFLNTSPCWVFKFSLSRNTKSYSLGEWIHPLFLRWERLVTKKEKLRNIYILVGIKTCKLRNCLASWSRWGLCTSVYLSWTLEIYLLCFLLLTNSVVSMGLVPLGLLLASQFPWWNVVHNRENKLTVQSGYCLINKSTWIWTRTCACKYMHIFTYTHCQKHIKASSNQVPKQQHYIMYLKLWKILSLDNFYIFLGPIERQCQIKSLPTNRSFIL